MSQEEIYQAAKTRNEQMLHRLCEVNSIDMWKTRSYYYSAATELAAARDYESVEFLLAHGSNLSYAVLGAALAHDHSYVKRLLSRGADITYAAMGYAESGELTKAYEFLKLGADLSRVTVAAAKGLNAARIDERLFGKLTAFIQTLLIEMNACRSDVLFGAVLGGDEIYAAELYAQKTQSEIYAFDEVITNALAFRENLIRNHDVFYTLWMTAGHFNKIKTSIQGNDLQSYCEYRNWHLLLLSAGHFSAFTQHFGVKYETEQAYTRERLASGDLKKINAVVTQFKKEHPNNPHKFLLTLLNHLPQLHQWFQNIILIKVLLIILEKILLVLQQKLPHTVPEANENCGYLITDLSAGFGKIKSKEHLLFILPLLDIEHLPQIFKALSYKYSRLSINSSIQASMTQKIKMIQQDELSQVETMVLIDAKQQGLLQILAMLALSLPCSLNKLLPDINYLIMQYLLPIELSKQEMNHLGYIAAKQHLSAQLTTYAKQPQAEYSNHAKSFNEAIQATETVKEMKELINKQKSLVQGKNSYPWYTHFKPYRQNLSVITQNESFVEIIKKWHPTTT